MQKQWKQHLDQKHVSDVSPEGRNYSILKYHAKSNAMKGVTLYNLGKLFCVFSPIKYVIDHGRAMDLNLFCNFHVTYLNHVNKH